MAQIRFADDKEKALLKGDSEKSHEVHSAALYMRDAVDGAHRIHPQEGPKYRTAYIWHLQVVYWLPFWSVLPLLLHLFERPLWCQKWMADEALTKRIAEPCQHEWYPSYPVQYLHLKWNFIIEVILFIPLAGHSLLLWYAHGPNFWKRTLLKARMVLIVVYVMDMIYCYSTPVTYFRLAPYLRVGFVVVYSTEMRQRLQLVLRTLPEVLSITAVCGAFCLFSAWVGILLFPNEGPDSEGEQYFPNLGVGMWSLYILMTTANFPDVMMPAYDKNRWAALFFIVFSAISCFFLVNVLTAAVFNEFSRMREEFFEDMKANYEECFRKAWDILSLGQGKSARVPKSAILAVFEEFNNYHGIERIDSDQAELKFDKLDTDNTDNLTWDQFLTLGRKLGAEMKEKKANPGSITERMLPGLKKKSWWNTLKESLKVDHNFDRLVDVVLVLNAVLLVMQTWGAIMGNETEDEKEFEKSKVLEDIITAFYFFEAALKIVVLGWTNYISVPKNRFDFLVTFFTTATAIYVWIPNQFNSHQIVRYVSMLRLLRVLRLFTLFGPFRMVSGTFIVMLPQAVIVTKVLGVVLYVFALIGCQCFGEVINKDPESVYGQRLSGGDFADANYWANNFNDVFSGMVTLFELLVVNNWFVLADGYQQACDSHWPYAYFVVFHVISVCCVLNIVVSFIIDAYFDEYDKRIAESEDSEEQGFDKVKTSHGQVDIKVGSTALLQRKTVSKLKGQLAAARTKSGSKPAAQIAADQFGESSVTKHFKKFIQALDWDKGETPGLDELDVAFEEALPGSRPPGFEEGLSLLAPFAEALVQHALEKQAEEAAPFNRQDVPLEI